MFSEDPPDDVWEPISPEDEEHRRQVQREIDARWHRWEDAQERAAIARMRHLLGIDDDDHATRG